ncbi:MAG: PIN domain-containing protein [Terriglobales bacterium]
MGGQRFEATFSRGCLGNSARARGGGGSLCDHGVGTCAAGSSREGASYGPVETTLRLLLEDVTILPITPEIAALATQFPDDYPRDLSDRLMGATAREDGMMLVTRDQRIADAGDAGEGARATFNR